MEKKKYNNLIYLLVGIILILFGIAGYKVLKNHQEKEYLVVYEKIKEAAKECYLDGACSSQITLQDLYDKNYLDKVIDPVTKEDMDSNLCIEYVDEKVEFCN